MIELCLCLESLGAREEDEIILSDFNVPEVVALPACCGLVPALIDIDPKTFNINDNLSKFTAKGKQLGATLENTGIFFNNDLPKHRVSISSMPSEPRIGKGF